MTEHTVGVVELEITPLDQYYYVSREAGDTFRTKPYLMHTALFYALGLLPTRFRVGEQTPSYTQHFKNADGTDGLYIHPARLIGEREHTTRRFSVKGDTFRSEAVQENKNLLETGHQRTLQPDLTFRTFVICRGRREPGAFAERISPYVRVGKKMTTAKVRTRIHEGESEEGCFELGQPVGKSDVPQDEYDVLGDITMESMAPVNILTSGNLSGPHVSITPSFGPGNDETVSLPIEAEFLGIQQ